LPQAEDAEFLPIKISASLASNSPGGSTSKLPPFIKLQGKSLAIKPTTLKELGTYKLEVYLDDGYSKPNKYKMRVIVEPDPTAEDNHKGFQVSKAQVKLMQVTRDGKLRVRFLAPMQVSDFVRNFKNESIIINLMNEEQERV
jgi:hypothetical protein